VEQFQGKLGQMLLQGHDFRFQAAHRLSELGFFRQRGECRNGGSLMCLGSSSLPVRRLECGDFLLERRGSSRRPLQRASMQQSQLLDLLMPSSI
jgi:hypothetical protein